MRIIYWIRSFLATATSLVWTAVSAAAVILASGLLRRRGWADDVIWFWARVITFCYGINVKVVGEENLPEGGCLFVFNHSSHLDIPIFHHAVRKSARFGAKIELFKIPLFGAAMRVSGALPITRGDPEKVYRLYDQSIPLVRAGQSFILAAEGTRQLVPGVGAKFKAGPFVFAIKGQFPIVPVVIRGAAECLPKSDWIGCTRAWRYNVTVKILPPVPTKGLGLEDRPTLQEQVQNIMTKAYNAG